MKQVIIGTVASVSMRCLPKGKGERTPRSTVNFDEATYGWFELRGDWGVGSKIRITVTKGKH